MAACYQPRCSMLASLQASAGKQSQSSEDAFDMGKEMGSVLTRLAKAADPGDPGASNFGYKIWTMLFKKKLL